MDFCVALDLLDLVHVCGPRFNVAWEVALVAHAGCKNFTGPSIARLILGTCEGSITAGF